MEVTPNLTDKALRDYNLVKLAVDNGDQKAYAALMRHYRDAIYFIMLKMTNNPSDADDLTIEAFSKAFNKLGQYTPDYAFSTWLFRIATNNCIDFLRKSKKNGSQHDTSGDSQEDIELHSEMPSTSPDPEESLIKSQQVKMMRTVVEKLKPHYRTLVKMRYFQEYSYEEIAQSLNMPTGTVKAQLFRARELLYNILKHIEGRG
jgi:RNA polymerase sigma factor (sigma-70 family)